MKKRALDQTPAKKSTTDEAKKKPRIQVRELGPDDLEGITGANRGGGCCFQWSVIIAKRMF
jgi:hypothetical protein